MSSIRPWPPPYHLLNGPKLVLLAAGLTSDLTNSLVSPSPAQGVAICKPLCSSYQVAPGQAQVNVLGLHHSPLYKAPELLHPVVASFRPCQNTIQTPPQIIYPKSEIGRHQSLTKANPAPWNQPLQNSLYAVLTAFPHSQSA